MNLHSALDHLSAFLSIAFALPVDDNVGGYHPDANQAKWPIGSIWGVEGVILATIIFYLRPQNIVNLGVFSGCSLKHILRGVELVQEEDPDYNPAITAIDLNVPPPPALIPAGVDFIQGDALDYVQNMGAVDFLFEDLDHSAESVAAVWKAFQEKALPGGVIVSHDAAHYVVGNDVRLGIVASGVLEPLILDVEPSDCGLAVWQKPPVEEVEKDENLESMTVDELKEFAARRGFDLTGKRRKADIIKAIADAT